MLGNCPRCDLVHDAYDYAVNNGKKINSLILAKKFRLGFSGADKLCAQLEKIGIKII